MQTPETLDSKTLAPMPQEVGLGSEDASAVAVVDVAVSFDAGDFVWAKIKSHQWWPGRVCDPSEAPDHVKKSPRKDQRSVLVACFGEGSFAWCSPSQLKGFAENFEQMASSSSAKGFRIALDDAVGEVVKCLEAQLSCGCLPEEERSEIGKWLGKSGKIENFEVDGFVSLVRDVAVDVSVINVLEMAKLRSWVVAFERGLGAGHQMKGISELVDKIDLDVPVMEEGKEEGDEEAQVGGGGGVLKGPSDHGRKKRSMAVLIAQMDLDSVEVRDDEEEKNTENVDADVGGVKEEEVGSSRRERKKSKYLSPPYTDLTGGLVKSLLLSKSSEAKPRYAGLHNEEEEMSSNVLFEVDGFDMAEVISEFLATAVNPLHLKWNRLAKTVRGLFAEFRKYVHTGGAEFDEYQKELAESAAVEDDIIVNNEVGDKFEEGRKTEGRRGRKRKDEVNGEGELPLDKSEESGKKTEGKRGRKRKDAVNGEGEIYLDKYEISDKRTEGKRRRKRKVRVEGEGETPISKSEEGKKTEAKRGRKKKDKVNGDGEIPTDGNDQTSELVLHISKEGANGKTPVTPKLMSDDATSRRKRGRKMTETNQIFAVNLGSKSVTDVELGKTVQDQTNGEQMAITKTPTDMGVEDCSQVRQATGGRIRKNSKKGPIIDVPVNLGSEVINGSGETKSKRRRKNKSSEDPAAVLLTFSPETSLPSKEELISVFTKYGPVVQSQTELLKESCSAKVVFEKSSSADKAINDKVTALGLPVTSYQLCLLTGNLSSPSSQTPVPVPKPPLPYIRKSLERMISTLSGSALEKVVGTSEGLKPETRDNLVDEMQGLLLKVDKMLTGPAAGTST